MHFLFVSHQSDQPFLRYGQNSVWPWKITSEIFKENLPKLEELERLRSEDTPRRLMITHTIESYWIPSQKNYRSRTENVTERIRFSKSRWNGLADIGQGQRSSHATHLLMLVIICTKYGKNPSRTVDATKRTRFSRSRPNDLENIGQMSRVITCDTTSDANDDFCQIWKECKQNCRFFFQGESRKITKINEKLIF